MLSTLPRRVFFAIEPALTSSLICPALIKQKLSCRSSLAILMYHSVPRGVDNAPHPYLDLRVPSESFSRQMQYLHDKWYNVIGLDEYISIRANGGALPPKTVAITFDDGYRDNYTNAWPVLKKFGFAATIFLAVDYIDKNIRADYLSKNVGIEKDVPFLSWSEIKEMGKEGITFGSHTLSHPRLHQQSEEVLQSEIAESKEMIENNTGEKVSSFCFPYAFPGGKKSAHFRRISRQCLVNNGYKLGVTTTIGRNTTDTDIFFLRRIPVHVNDSIRRFAAKLAGAYDWVRFFQLFSKLAT